jgi:hypothetical protein
MHRQGANMINAIQKLAFHKLLIRFTNHSICRISFIYLINSILECVIELFHK